jgi:hypothetical protein
VSAERAVLRQEGPFWSVYGPNGRCYVLRESFGVADSIAHALNYPDQWEQSEAYEVAEAVAEAIHGRR